MQERACIKAFGESTRVARAGRGQLNPHGCIIVVLIFVYASYPHMIPLLATLAAALGPFGKLASLLADVHESRSALQGSERAAAIVLVNLARAVEEPGVALAFDFAGPYVPLNRPKLLGPEDQAQA